MAFPTIVGTAVTNGSTATTTPTFNLPSGIQADDQLLLVVRVNGSPGLTLTTTGWGQQMNTAADASDDTLFIKRKTAVGDEGTTLNGTFSASVKFAAIAVAVRNAAQGEINSTPATGTSTTPNPPSITAAGGAADNLWVWIGSWEGEQTSPPAGNPTNYTNPVGADSGTAGVVATNCRVAVAFRELNTATEDPPSWTISASDDWIAVGYVFPPRAAQNFNHSGTDGAKVTDTGTATPNLRETAAEGETVSDSAAAPPINVHPSGTDGAKVSDDGDATVTSGGGSFSDSGTDGAKVADDGVAVHGAAESSTDGGKVTDSATAQLAAAESAADGVKVADEGDGVRPPQSLTDDGADGVKIGDDAEAVLASRGKGRPRGHSLYWEELERGETKKGALEQLQEAADALLGKRAPTVEPPHEPKPKRAPRVVTIAPPPAAEEEYTAEYVHMLVRLAEA